MGFIDLIRELRTSKPDIRKAAKVMKLIGWACLAAGLWNFILPRLAQFAQSGFNIPESYPYAALTILSIVGILFLFSAHGIQDAKPLGCKIGQVAIVAAFLSCAGFMAWMPFMIKSQVQTVLFPNVFYIFSAIVLAQFGLPAFFGFRYLGKLAESMDSPIVSAASVKIPPLTAMSCSARRGARYKDSPFPFGIVGTFVPMVVVAVLGTSVVQQYAGAEMMGMFFMSIFLFIFIGPVIYNFQTSPFQRNRKFITAYTGGGSIFLFHGSWPFFMLLVYQDALEVRVMFHRFLIPFDKMEDIPEDIGFFSSGLLIRSDLPEVPSSIRFSWIGLKKIVQVVCDARRAYLSQASRCTP